MGYKKEMISVLRKMDVGSGNCVKGGGGELWG